MNKQSLPLAPAKVETWEFSWAKGPKQFRFRRGGEQVLVNSIEGTAYFEDADGVEGRLYLRCSLEVDEAGHATITAPDDCDAGLVAPLGEYQDADAWRVCFARNRNMWRLRDELAPGKPITFVSGYRGLAEVFWNDGQSHIFVRGLVHVDAQEMAWFGIRGAA